MLTNIERFAPWLLVLLLAGCTPPQGVVREVRVPVVEVTREDAVMRHVLAYYDRLGRMTDEERNGERLRLGENPTLPQDVVEQALVLGQTRGSGDVTRAIALLLGLTRSTEPDAAPWMPVARLLATTYMASQGEQRRLEDRLEKQAQQLRDSQKKQDQLGDKVDQLNQKLDALKAIELSLPSRPADAAPAAAPATKNAP